MQVSSFFLLLTVVTTVTAQSEYLDEQLRLPEVTDTLLEYCHHGEWRWICHDESQWNKIEISEAICEQLGYSNPFAQAMEYSTHNGERRVVTLSDCNGRRVKKCTVTPSKSCNSVVHLRCITDNSDKCADGEIRLVGGSTDREGRVEVCVGGRWRTVCTGSQDLAGAICSQMGYIFEESTVINSYPPGAFPEYRLNCTQLSNRAWHCSPVEQQCDSFVELGVVCINYEEFYQRSRNSTPFTQLPPIECTPSNERGTTCADISTTLFAGIGALVALLLSVSVGWMVSCVILLRRGHPVHKQHADSGTISTRSNQSHTQQDINTQLYAEATPPDTTYSRLNRSDKQTEEIATYDYADPNQIRAECSQATNPPPVTGEAIVREEEFYIAEDHTYAAVNKKAKKKKKPKNAESDGEGESEAPPPFLSTLAEV
ncbi:scavenger receptor cysteine-rich type 1 protein M160-like [Halichondria panicea]|uniref:scavenger receptor cysteine-rich type 1 protein M160-like n=1 Tax=Halichondria panicea TaxID=6063 RepID=UPI00312BB243